MIGCTTALIGDLASLFGCSLGLSGATTAITFVALGTSLPDTFASKAAAVQDATADVREFWLERRPVTHLRIDELMN
jgi:solute carrier family 8 (sodium/calcium exchanger)